MTPSMIAWRMKNRLLDAWAPDWMARRAAKLFLTPRRFPLKAWEHTAEASCRRFTFGHHLSAARWGSGPTKILLMHGWESRATQMFGLVQPLVAQGFEVTAVDAPRHGHSGGDKANPVAFADAIAEASRSLGPFHGAVGHSMGAAALAIAMEAGIAFVRSVLIAAPAGLHDNLTAFARHMGLSSDGARRFIQHVEKAVGRSAKSLDVGAIFARIRPEALLIHDENDREVPYAAMAAIRAAYPEIRTHTTGHLGHRRIVRNSAVAALVCRYLAQIPESAVAGAAPLLSKTAPTAPFNARSEPMEVPNHESHTT